MRRQPNGDFYSNGGNTRLGLICVSLRRTFKPFYKQAFEVAAEVWHSVWMISFVIPPISIM